MIDFGDLFAGDPACDLATAWTLLPDDTADHFHSAHQPTPDAATLRRARGWAAGRALSAILIGEASLHGRPGGEPPGADPPTPHCDTSSRQPLTDQRFRHTLAR